MYASGEQARSFSGPFHTLCAVWFVKTDFERCFATKIPFDNRQGWYKLNTFFGVGVEVFTQKLMEVATDEYVRVR